MKISFLLLSFLFASYCFADDCHSKKILKEYKPKYASHFNIRYYENFKIISSGTGELKDEIIVGRKHPDCTTSLPFFTSETKRFIATSTTHLPFLFFFGLEKTLIGFQGVNYISHPKLKTNVVKNINYQLNEEQLLSLKPDLVMAYSANLPGWKKIKYYRNLKIPLIMNWDFAETHPLARAEWMIFSSAFFSRDEIAIDYFKNIEMNYQELKQKAINTKKPVILIGEIQNGRWATCGGKSDLAILIRDAGGRLLFDNNSMETQFISLEKIFENKQKPDFWLPQNNWKNLELIKKDSRYGQFFGVPVFNNNAKINANGFNDYWETGLSRPDLLLRDLFLIFHPGKIPAEEPLWYKRLQ